MPTSFKILFFLINSTIIISAANAQKPAIPKSYSFENTEDYKRHENKVIELSEWLINTPLSSEPDTRAKANRFVTKWIVGVPYVNLVIDGDIVNFGKANKDLVIAYMAGYLLYMIKNHEASDIRGNLAGVDAAIHLYEISSIERIDHMEKLIKLKKNKQLVGYIRNELK